MQLGDDTSEEKPKRTSLPRGMKPEEVTLDKAIQLLGLPRILGKDPTSNKDVAVSIGRFGPYVVHDGDFRSLDASRIFTVTLEEALSLLAQPKSKRGAKKLLQVLREKTEDQGPIELYEGRYGPYVTDGATNASLPKTLAVEQVTLDLALRLIGEAGIKKKAKSARTRTTATKKKTAARSKKK